jgi:DnaJ like chaperone protein
MSWFGKVVGGTFGFIMGGPLGALMGVALGNYFDGGLENASRGGLGIGATGRVQSVFFSVTFSVMGYVAKSDGKVTKDEIALAEQVMDQMRLSPQQRKIAVTLFNEGKKPDFQIHEVLQQFKKELYRRKTLVQMFLEIISAVALSDGKLDIKEQAVLETIATDLGYTLAEFNELLGRLSGQAQFSQHLSSEEKLTAAYELLGIEKGADGAEVKKAYRRQMNQHHPDKLVAKGLPEEMIDIATKKTQDIKAAYELIKAQA